MPSPFPGMDPYLEGRLLWHDVHQRLAGQISRQLAPHLSPRYVARLATRFVTSIPSEQEISIIYPDADVTPTRLRERTSTQLRRPPTEPPTSVAPAAFEPVIPKKSACVVVVMGLDGVDKPLDEQWVFRSRLYSQFTGLPARSTISENSVATIILDDRGLFKGCPSGAKRCVFLNKAEGVKRVTSGEKIGMILKERGGEHLDKIMIGSLKQDAFRTIYG